MQLDWFTVAVQIINFLVLVWLLKRFLYRPVVEAMARREERIADRMNEAEAAQRKAEAEQQRYVELQEKLRLAAEEEMVKAKQEAALFRDELMVAARAEVERLRQQWLATLAKERNGFLGDASAMVAGKFEKLVAKALRDLAGLALEERMIDVLLAKLSELPREDREMMAQAVTVQGEPVLVDTVHGLDGQTQQRVTMAVTGIWPGARVVFARDKSLVAGITLEAGGKKVRWDISAYLEEFHDQLAAALARHPSVH